MWEVKSLSERVAECSAAVMAVGTRFMAVTSVFWRRETLIEKGKGRESYNDSPKKMRSQMM